MYILSFPILCLNFLLFHSTENVHLFLCLLSLPLTTLILHLVQKAIHNFFPFHLSKMFNQFYISSVLVFAEKASLSLPVILPFSSRYLLLACLSGNVSFILQTVIAPKVVLQVLQIAVQVVQGSYCVHPCGISFFPPGYRVT